MAKPSESKPLASPTPPFVPSIERLDPEMDAIVPMGEEPEIIANGFAWTEGPSWEPRAGRLFFSDIPNNRIHTWSPSDGLGVFRDPAGAPGPHPCPEAMPGTNGLFYTDEDQALLICNQDARSVDRLDLRTGTRTRLAERFNGARFNSPNDVIRGPDGCIYFTDPPFGLLDQAACAHRDMDYTGVFRIDAEGHVSCLSKKVSFPNGLAFSADGRSLYVSQSDEAAPHIMAFSVRDGQIQPGPTIWCDLSRFAAAGDAGLPDGMTVDTDGHVFATCAGGVAIIRSDGQILGRIRTGRATSNCTFGEDGSALFITSHDLLLRLETRVRGWPE